MIPAPTLMSDALERAVKDVRKGLDDPNVELDMSGWLYRHEDKVTCGACMAGVVMIYSLGALDLFPKRAGIYTDDFPYEWRNVLEAINHMRVGDFWLAAHSMGIRLTLDQRNALSKTKLARDSYDIQCGVEGMSHLYVYEEAILKLRELNL